MMGSLLAVERRGAGYHCVKGYRDRRLEIEERYRAVFENRRQCNDACRDWNMSHILANPAGISLPVNVRKIFSTA